ncbi:hypothetical protein ACFVUY_08040 [Kitasatospora sp. NPDC058063]|uniref:hypothetical protein n=1 Tax=unclassified Kitasatospora TaxID=2633591 RepID=UPI0036D8AA0E
MKKTLAWAVTVVTAATCTLGAALPAVASDATTPPAATSAAVTSAAPGSTFDTSRLSPDLKALADQALAKLPADWQQHRDAATAAFGIHDTQWAAVRDSVINPGDYQCESNALRDYQRTLLQGANFEPLFFLYFLGVFDMPTYDALYFGSESKSNTFGVNGEYTNELTSESKDLKRFWDIHSDDIQLVPMHGRELFSSPERLAPVVSLMYGIPEENHEVALGLASLIIHVINLDPVLQGGDNPFFTLNAFAFSEKGAPHPAGIGDRIVMGDGILEAMRAIGLGTTAPRAILAHEFGHHVQYEDDLIGDRVGTPEGSRRVELMADAYGTYFLTHSRGEALNAKRLLDSEKSFYQVGDCAFSSPGHHGTPNQRFATASWAAGVANDAANQGHILPSLTFDALFETKLPDLVKPDATN